MASRCFPGGYNVKLYISSSRLAWWLLAFLHSENKPLWFGFINFTLVGPNKVIDKIFPIVEVQGEILFRGMMTQVVVHKKHIQLNEESNNFNVLRLFQTRQGF